MQGALRLTRRSRVMTGGNELVTARVKGPEPCRSPLFAY